MGVTEIKGENMSNKNYYAKRIRRLVLMSLMAMLSLLISSHSIAASNIQQSTGILVLTVKGKFQKAPLPFTYAIFKIDKGKTTAYFNGTSETGKLSVKMISGSYKIRVSPSDVAYKSEELATHINPGKTTTLEVLADYKGGTETVKVSVQDANGKSVVQAEVTLKNVEQNTSETKVSSEDGEAVFANKNLDFVYSLEVNKTGYKTKKMTLRKLTEGQSPYISYQSSEKTLYVYISLVSEEGLAAVVNNVIIPEVLKVPRPFYSSDSELKIIYYPVLSQEALVGLKSLDAKLMIFSKKKLYDKDKPAASYPNQDMNFQLELVQNNIKLYNSQIFKFSLQPGFYMWGLSFVLHYEDKDTVFPIYSIGEIAKLKSDESFIDYDVSDSFSLEPYGGQIEVLPSQTAPELMEVMPNHNNINDLNRFNIVFVRHLKADWDNWKNNGFSDDDVFKIVVNQITGKFGLFNVEPFKSNLDLFNVWYSNEIIDGAGADLCKMLQSNNGIIDVNKLSEYMKFRLGLSLPNLIVVTLDNYPSNGILAGTCWSTDSINIGIPTNGYLLCKQNGISSIEECSEKLAVSRSFLHETGHYIAYLLEEYNTNHFFDPQQFIDEFYVPYNSSHAGDSSIFTDKINTATDCVEKNSMEIKCTPNEEAVAYCLNNARWRDLIGNGCGVDGIVDCDKINPFYKFEVTCNAASAGSGGEESVAADINKSTEASIMDDKISLFDMSFKMDNFTFWYDTSTDYQGRLFGQVNERLLCRYFKLNTGIASGICDQLCLEGCSDREKCINGMCQ